MTYIQGALPCFQHLRHGLANPGPHPARSLFYFPHLWILYRVPMTSYGIFLSALQSSCPLLSCDDSFTLPLKFSSHQPWVLGNLSNLGFRCLGQAKVYCVEYLYSHIYTDSAPEIAVLEMHGLLSCRLDIYFQNTHTCLGEQTCFFPGIISSLLFILSL